MKPKVRISMEKELVNKIFDTLDKWRNFPAYQLERRADIFFAIYLSDILYKATEVKIDLILPEFPIRLGEIEDNNSNQSYKIDYLAVSQNSNKVFFVELKTDKSSRRENQDDYLQKAKSVNISNLINGLLKIYKATNEKAKYSNYLQELIKISWVKLEDQNYTNSSKNCNIQIIYIQPTKQKSDEYFTISFDDIVGYLSDHKDFLTQRFLLSLKEWESKPGKINPS